MYLCTPTRGKHKVVSSVSGVAGSLASAPPLQTNVRIVLQHDSNCVSCISSANPIFGSVTRVNLPVETARKVNESALVTILFSNRSRLCLPCNLRHHLIPHQIQLLKAIPIHPLAILRRGHQTTASRTRQTLLRHRLIGSSRAVRAENRP
jgi:hypothetical protein